MDMELTGKQLWKTGNHRIRIRRSEDKGDAALKESKKEQNVTLKSCQKRVAFLVQTYLKDTRKLICMCWIREKWGQKYSLAKTPAFHIRIREYPLLPLTPGSLESVSNAFSYCVSAPCGKRTCQLRPCCLAEWTGGRDSVSSRLFFF